MPRTRIDLFAITQWITAAAREHPEDLAAHLTERLGVSRRSAQQVLQSLVAGQWLVCEGTPRRRRYRPGPLRQVVRRYPIAGLQEDLPWARDFAPHFDFAPNVARLMQHAFTELLNNAIDHSGGSRVTVSMRQTATHAQLLVSDDGRGVFEQIRERFDIADPALAALELSKGKLTSDPACHTGRGLFFTARMADVFDLQANDRAFQHRSWDGARPLRERPPGRNGTSVFVGIALDTERALDEVLRSHSSDGAGYGFERTVVPLRLLAHARCRPGVSCAGTPCRGAAVAVPPRRHRLCRVGGHRPRLRRRAVSLFRGQLPGHRTGAAEPRAARRIDAGRGASTGARLTPSRARTCRKAVGRAVMPCSLSRSAGEGWGEGGWGGRGPHPGPLPQVGEGANRSVERESVWARPPRRSGPA